MVPGMRKNGCPPLYKVHNTLDVCQLTIGYEQFFYLRLTGALIQNQDVSWIPVHFAAQALVDFTSASFDTSNIVHLVHPRSVPWSTIADVLSSTLSVPLVTFPEWFAKLELLAAKKPDGSENIEMLRKVSALRLLPILRQMSSKTNRSPTLGTSTVDLTRALALSPTLANPSFPQLGSTEVISWVKYWSRLNFL